MPATGCLIRRITTKTKAQAVKKAGLAREEVLITSKLPGRYHTYSKAVVAVQESLFRAGLDYYDLYLIHWPNPRVNLYVEAWQALIDARKWGLIRSIGVCNFLPEHIERLEKETDVLPSINQIELHPYFSQKAMSAWNHSKGIVTEAWSPLGRKKNDILLNPVIIELASAHGKSPVQIVLRWELQQGIVPIPKASTLVRQKENLDIFDFVLSESEMDAMFALDKPDGRVSGLDPAVYEEF